MNIRTTYKDGRLNIDGPVEFKPRRFTKEGESHFSTAVLQGIIALIKPQAAALPTLEIKYGLKGRELDLKSAKVSDLSEDGKVVGVRVNAEYTLKSNFTLEVGLG